MRALPAPLRAAVAATLAAAAARVSRLAFHLVLRLADAAARPEWEPGWPQPAAPGPAL